LTLVRCATKYWSDRFTHIVSKPWPPEWEATSPKFCLRWPRGDPACIVY